MQLTGLHLLLTYQCNLECDHCFVWGSPWQQGTMTLSQIRDILQQAEDTGSITSFYFEGGEPFLYYPIMVRGIQLAAAAGFRVGIVTNSYWATSKEDALEWLTPLADHIYDLWISNDRYHWYEELSEQEHHARCAAEELDIPFEVIRIAQPDASDGAAGVGQIPPGESILMYRGRAAEKLSSQSNLHPWSSFDSCPFEDLRDPGRVHLDPQGNLHICQGISLGNINQTPLEKICTQYEPDSHPIIGPLLSGGPAELVREHDLAVKGQYADACHLCCEARAALRQSFPQILGPDQMYGVYG